MGYFAKEEKDILYDVVQAIALAHDLYMADNEDASAVNKELTKDDVLVEENVFAYWFYTMLFSVLAWRVGFDQASKIGYGALFGVMNQSLNGERDDWPNLVLGLSQSREMAETVADFLFGFKGVADFESEERN